MQQVYRSSDGLQRIDYNPDHRYFDVVSVGDIPHRTYQESNNVMFDAVGRYRTMKILFNLKDLTRTDMISRAWYTTSFLPRLFRRYGSHFVVAVVKSKNRFENMSTEFLAKAAMRLGMKGEVKFFSSEEEARAWVEAQSFELPKGVVATAGVQS